LAQDFYWLAFTDKNNSEYTFASPEDFLSVRALERRAKQNIQIDSLDLPVNSNYISQVLNLGVTFVHASKWLNGITVKVEIDSFEFKAGKLPFVKEIQRTKTKLTTKSAINKFGESGNFENVPIDTSMYGQSVFQIGIMNGQYLHNQNYLGQGMQIAVLDGGFLNTNSYFAFDSLWANNQILGIKDFVDPAADFFSTHYHGMSVLSCMGGNVPGDLIGTAPKASYWLLRSEDTDTEFLIEEDNWVAAAEFADSVGVDVINSSLGYFEFDDPEMNHTYADMDGKTTRVTKGANIAASRGILVFSSAGNEGNKLWKYLIAPSDGDSVIGVGAAGKDSIPAFFTSYGPSFVGDIKPNVSGVGLNTWLMRPEGVLGFASGTSFSSPVMAGMGASLWSAVPHASAKDVKNAIERSAHQFLHPDTLLGYGIPDFGMAFLELFNLNVPAFESEKQWTVYPNPVNDYVVLQNNSGQLYDKIEIEIFSLEGRLIQKWIKSYTPRIELRNIGSLPAGILLLKISSGNSSETLKLGRIR
jgi:subtilisin family serine protease